MSTLQTALQAAASKLHFTPSQVIEAATKYALGISDAEGKERNFGYIALRDNQSEAKRFVLEAMAERFDVLLVAIKHTSGDLTYLVSVRKEAGLRPVHFAHRLRVVELRRRQQRLSDKEFRQIINAAGRPTIKGKLCPWDLNPTGMVSGFQSVMNLSEVVETVKSALQDSHALVATS